MTTTTIAVFGATGTMGGKIVNALIARGAAVKALARPSATSDKVAPLKKSGVELVRVEVGDGAALVKALEGVACVVSAVQGLRDVLIDAQSQVLDAAVKAGVPRFIPSDYASDFTKLAPGENRNFDLRREFHGRLDKATIKPTSVLNGAFAEILGYGTPLLDFQKHTVAYWESEDWRCDYTAMNDVAAFTAAAALDASAPRILRIAGFQVNAKELAATASEVTKTPFTPVKMGSRDDLGAYAKRDRAAHPGGENEVMPGWQRTQYMHSMFSVQLAPLDNARYPGVAWTGVKDVVATAAANPRR